MSMRLHRLGANTPAKNWTPAFTVPRGIAPNRAKVGRKNTSIMSYYPTLKGEPRMEGLHRYFHANMATILDARFEVTAWTAATVPTNCEWRGGLFEFTPDFHVLEGQERHSIRLIRKGSARSEIRAERHAAVDRAYREVGERLVVVTEDELAADVRLPAANELFYNRMRDIPRGMPEILVDEFSGTCPTTLGELHAVMGGGDLAWVQLLCLVALGYVHASLDGGLDDRTPVHAVHELGYRR